MAVEPRAQNPDAQHFSRLYRGRKELIDHIFVKHALVGKVAQDHVTTDAADPTPSIDDDPRSAAGTRVRSSTPGGPSRICVVAGSTNVVEITITITASLRMAGEQIGGGDAHGGRFGGAPMRGIRGEAGPLTLVVGGESAAGKRQQLRFQFGSTKYKKAARQGRCVAPDHDRRRHRPQLRCQLIAHQFPVRRFRNTVASTLLTVP
jgi:hypothetical protein